MKLLIIDDDITFTDLLRRRLTQEGFMVECAYNGHDGIERFNAMSADIVVLDAHLPGKLSGFDVCQQIRRRSTVPILMFSGTVISEPDVVRGLELGADDYLMKPIRPNEFVARLHAMLRRSQMQRTRGQNQYDDGHLRIDLRRRQVYKAERHVHLTPTEFKLLAVLIENAGKVVSQKELLEQVWGNEYIEDIYYPRIYISQLRRKLEDDPTRPLYILTEHRAGYRFQKHPISA